MKPPLSHTVGMAPGAWYTVKDRGAGVRPFSRVSAGLCSSCETLYKLSSWSPMASLWMKIENMGCMVIKLTGLTFDITD